MHATNAHPLQSQAVLQFQHKLRSMGGSKAGGVGPVSMTTHALPPATLPASLLVAGWERGQLVAQVPAGLQNSQLEVRWAQAATTGKELMLALPA